VPKEDALSVSRLKSAGALILGKTNVPLGPRRFPKLERPLRNDQQSVGHRSFPRWLLGRGRCGSRPRLWTAFVRIRHWRIVARAGTLLRRLRAQADVRLVPMRADTTRRHSRHCQATATLPWSARWPEPPPISGGRLTWSPVRTRSVRGRLSVGVASGTARQFLQLPRSHYRHPSAHADGQRCAHRDRPIVEAARQNRRQGRVRTSFRPIENALFHSPFF
jgi:hypothetical protein